jgi:hypothetical protein
MEHFKSKSYLNSFIKSSSHVGNIIIGVSSASKALLQRSLGDNLVKLHIILTFPLCKASPSAYSSFRNAYMSLVYSFMHVMYCALRVGFLDDMMICCMVVPFHILFLLLMYYFYA